ncbi:hypothetical protein ACTMU2_29230 [Cupriavidus basilensis]
MLATAAHIGVTTASALLAAADISMDEPHAAMARLGLQMIEPDS